MALPGSHFGTHGFDTPFQASRLIGTPLKKKRSLSFDRSSKARFRHRRSCGKAVLKDKRKVRQCSALSANIYSSASGTAAGASLEGLVMPRLGEPVEPWWRGRARVTGGTLRSRTPGFWYFP
jgi:hypothetical protein